MSVIIRLQNLPWTANARDIRNFFTGLSIPEGGVHIIGGEMGDAFIAFSTDEDARCAMLKDREKLMEIQVRLLLSSRAEMQKVIETARTPVVAPSPVPVPVPVPMPVPVATPQPPIIGGLNSFLSQSQSKAEVPSFLAYQQQAGIVLAEVTGGSASASGSQNRRQSRSRSRSRSSSSEDSDRELRERERERERELERDRERDRAIRKRRLERGDSNERELKLQSSGLSGVAGGLSPWANPPQTAAAVSLPGLGSIQGMSMGMGHGLGLGVPSVLPSLQNYTTSNTTNNITNNYNMSSANGPAPAPAPPLAPDAQKLIAALQAAARAASNSPAQLEGQQQAQVQRQPQAQAMVPAQEPVAFASVNPYAQIYPQLFQQQQQVLLQQQTAAKLSPSVGGSPGGGGGGLSPRGGGGMSSAVADTCYVKISGMCQNTSYSDLRKYFQGLYIPHNGIKIMTVNGSRTGVAYIEFSRVSSAQKALQRNNTMFRDRQVQIVPIGDAEFEQAEEKSRSQQHQPPQDVVGRNAGDRGGGSLPSFNVLYVEDLPQLTTEQDIMKMFSATCTIVDILLAPSPNNRREFVAFVLFARETEALSALEDTSRHYIGFRQLRVRPSSQAEMLQAKEKQRRANEQLLKEEADQREELLKDQKRRQEVQAQLQLQQQQQQQREESAMQARYNSDPRRRNADDNPIRDQQHPQQQQLLLQQNHMQPFGNTGPMGNGIMPFVVQQQLQQLQQQNSGSNFPFNNNNNNNNIMENHNRNQNQNHNGGGGGGPMDASINRYHNGGGPFGMPMPPQNESVRPPRQEDNFVRIHNCEYATRVNDLGELFSRENLRIEHIEMLLNDRNQSSGEFIIEFADGPNAKQAIREFHNRRFRGRGLRVVAITPQEIADRMNKPFMDYFPGGNGPRQSDNGGASGQGSAQPTSRRRGPSRFDNQQQQQQQQQQVPQERQRQEDEDSNSSQKQHFNPFARPDPPIIPSGAGSGSLSPGLNVSNSSSSSSSIPDKFNRPGCVVAMRNVPFKAELKDILRFFSDYKLSPDDIIRRFNDDGKPTGDTRVAFESPAEARSAYESRRRKQIFSRTVHLDII
ncbi:uncharacterized protein [Drosophila pseudoobscura]|uniref:RRM domain-containing protein n=1 Tax=Drosophila pseudoobscura pseudoobscura TaxID=46245 RepID=A0A6I8VKT2_DROPS|nr:uncharacterized protein LOC4813385 [Drosophila pseudoobscura]XP_015042994.2 uncharacterized protein LOC4813385 [Drosophila pseudoobscura]